MPEFEQDIGDYQAGTDYAALARYVLKVVRKAGCSSACSVHFLADDRDVERAFNPDRKDHHWGRRKLARDR
jgi:hypothetical protein